MVVFKNERNVIIHNNNDSNCFFRHSGTELQREKGIVERKIKSEHTKESQTPINANGSPSQGRTHTFDPPCVHFDSYFWLKNN